MVRSNTRRHERIPSSDTVRLRWSGASGEAHFARGKLLNSSSSGVCVETVEPIKPLSYVTLDAPGLNRGDWGAAGSVRHCTSKGAKFFIGVELRAGRKWD